MTESLAAKRLAVLVHEVRSPVAALAAIAETIAEGGDRARPAPDRAELVRLAITACRGLERIVVDAVIGSVRRDAVDVGALVRAVVATESLGGARIDADVAADLPPVSGDAVRLRQALDNLVSNALVHSGTNKAVVGARATAGDVQLFVSDQGPGIPLSEQDRIFEAGERLDPTRPGSGLGLAIVTSIVEAHGGTLALSSRPGEGTTFTIVLPASLPAI